VTVALTGGVDGSAQVWVPRRLRQVCRWSAVAVLVLVLVLTVALRASAAGSVFGFGDQLSLIALGAVIAAALLYAGRPRVVADARTVRVRNMLGTVEHPWSGVVAVQFDEHSSWPTLELPADASVALLGIQRSDGPAADRAVVELRRLHAAARTANSPAGGSTGRA
jgi:hypothetical protein